ncbi:MAG: hypothetical protein AAF752_12680, partial [Bacteroidota bacterium]
VAGRYALLQVGEREPARAMTFDEARPEIERILHRELVPDALRAHVDSLKSRYGVEVDAQALHGFPLRKNG